MVAHIVCELCGAILEDHYYRVRIVYDTSDGRRLVLAKLRVCEDCLARLKKEYRGKAAKVRYRKVKMHSLDESEEVCHDPPPDHPLRVFFEELLEIYDKLGSRLMHLTDKIRENPRDNKLRAEFNRLWKKRKRLAVELLSAIYYAPCNLKHRVEDIKEFYFRTSKEKWLKV